MTDIGPCDYCGEQIEDPYPIIVRRGLLFFKSTDFKLFCSEGCAFAWARGAT